MQIIETVHMSTTDAVHWAAKHGIPGLPCRGYSIEVENKSQLMTYSLENRNDSFTMTSRKGVALSEGGFYKDAEGDIVQVSMTHPGTEYPFSDNWFGLRYTADGKNIRRGRSLWDRGADIVGSATDQDVYDFAKKHDTMASKAECDVAFRKVSDMIDVDGPYGAVKSDDVLDALYELRDNTSDLAVARACVALIEEARIADSSEPVMLLTPENQDVIERKLRVRDRIRTVNVAGAGLIGILTVLAIAKSSLLPWRGTNIDGIIAGLGVGTQFAWLAVWASVGSKIEDRINILRAALSFEYHYPTAD